MIWPAGTKTQSNMPIATNYGHMMTRSQILNSPNPYQNPVKHEKSILTATQSESSKSSQTRCKHDGLAPKKHAVPCRRVAFL